MADHGRQSLSSKAGAAIKPDSEKTFTEHMGDKIKGNADSAASHAQPQHEKSTTQKMGDAVSGQSNHNPGERTMGEKVKDAVGLGHGHH